MEEDVALCPMNIHFFVGIQIVFDANVVAQLVEKFLEFG